MMHFDPLHGTLSAIKITNFWKSKMTDGCQLESKNCNIWVMVWPIYKIWHSDAY